MSASATRQATEHWNKTPLFLAEEERYSAYPWLYEAAEFRHHRGERVLEIGCGTGADLLQFAKHGALVTGIDITSEHLKLARERVGNRAQVLYADATNIPFKAASFDYVYSHGVLHHIDRPRLVVEEIFRLLRPGGRFNVHVYAYWSYAHLNYRRIFGREWKLNVENSRDPVYLDLYTSRQLRKLFAPASITLEKYEYYRWQALGRWIGWFLVAKGIANPSTTRPPGDP
jgi:ubiquinone/menaquinone biosynthesis C-methylase UbiE